MYVLLLALIAGIGIGSSGLLNRRSDRLLDVLTNAVLFCILFIMGAKLSDPKIIRNLDKIGINGVVFALFTISGSLIFVLLFKKIIAAIATSRKRRLPLEPNTGKGAAE
jgi:predicted permease